MSLVTSPVRQPCRSKSIITLPSCVCAVDSNEFISTSTDRVNGLECVFPIVSLFVLTAMMKDNFVCRHKVFFGGIQLQSFTNNRHNYSSVVVGFFVVMWTQILPKKNQRKDFFWFYFCHSCVNKDFSFVWWSGLDVWCPNYNTWAIWSCTVSQIGHSNENS